MQPDVDAEVDAYGEILKELKPTTASSKAETLEYPQLKTENFDKDEGGFEAEHQEINDELIRLKRQDVRSKVKHLELLAKHANDDSIPVDNRQFAADEFTKISIKMYGEPDPEVAGKILNEGLVEFYGKYDDIRTLVKSYLHGEYPGLFDLFGDDNQRWVGPSEIAELFEKGLNYLKSQNQKDWGDWQVLQVDSDKLSVSRSSKTICVGLHRSSDKLITVKGLFAHEVLRHARTAINGAKLDSLLSSGLPDHVPAEEGFATINEFAIADKIPDKLVDRYVDISAALGQLRVTSGNHIRIKRSKLVLAVIERLRRRYPDKSQDEIENIAYAHVNRIFRGTPGNDAISGVFTKDVVYFNGFIDMLKYIRAELDGGKSIKEIMKFVELGKFDPTNSDHVDYVKNKLKQA
ncbi:flavohemoglobin expression-modulating QEGLA motif protein [Candidatus Saccharibacteria bacterium]|nr:flavohemoglobin expression-modulating QEGLA motif protein [Candidatus Saccharibacteria bacterium]